MKRRLALKICRALHDPLRYRMTGRGLRQSLRHRGKWKFNTVHSANKIGRDRFDERFPYVPTDEEQVESFGFGMAALIDCLAPTKEEATRRKDELWEMLMDDAE